MNIKEVSFLIHEMKSPFSLIKLHTENLLKNRKNLSKEQVFDAKSISSIVDDASQTINRLLEVFSDIKVDYKAVYPGKILNKVVNKYRTNRNIITDIYKDIKLKTHALLLECVYTNLIDNALKYSDTSSTIYINQKTFNNRINFQIKNSIGLDLGSSTSQIGLKFTKDIIRKLGGKLKLSKKNGLFFAEFYLPIKS